MCVDIVTESASLNSTLIEEIKSKEAAFATLTRELEELKLKGIQTIFSCYVLSLCTVICFIFG